MSETLGLNEAHILSVISDGEPRAIADIIEALDRLKLQREIREATAYMALQRMRTRGFVEATKTRVKSSDGRPRDIGVYKITPEGRSAVQQFGREVSGIGLRLGLAGAK